MPDVRLIDANVLLKTLSDLEYECINQKQKAACNAVLHDFMPQIINDEPTIDAQPVKHGRFVFEKGDYRNTVDGYRCTSCGETYHTKVPYFSEYKFCPNCGAKMDGDADA